MEQTPAIGTPEYDQLKARLSAEIHALRPDKRFYAGRRFFSLLLQEQGVGAVYHFLERASQALEKNGELEVADFDDDEAFEDLFKRSRIKLYTRRAAMGVIAEGAGGAALAAYGAAGIADQIRGAMQSPDPDGPKEKHSFAKQLDTTVMPYAYVAIGGSMMDAAHRHSVEYKLGDIANAVTRLIDKLPPLQKADMVRASQPGEGVGR